MVVKNLFFILWAHWEDFRHLWKCFFLWTTFDQRGLLVEFLEEWKVVSLVLAESQLIHSLGHLKAQVLGRLTAQVLGHLTAQILEEHLSWFL